jgi:hypothetical protein
MSKILQTEKKVFELRSQFQHYDLYKKLITIYDIKIFMENQLFAI